MADPPKPGSGPAPRDPPGDAQGAHSPSLLPRASMPPSTATKSERFSPGSLVAGKYLVQRVIGEGGIGVVVAARHVHLDQTVAIKYLQPKVLSNPSVIDRFLREARLAAQIRSEHVVHVYDVGTLTDGSPYMVMEYLEGTDLAAVLGSGPLTIERAVDYTLQACEALAQAHIAGIVHRDLKPENLFLASRAAGRSVIKILDFGISKVSARRTASLPEVTQASDKFGTPVYMSPEQLVASSDVDARADVWALGVVFYELLTGKLPFERDSLPELCTAILTQAPTPLAVARASLPLGLQGVVDRCLDKNRATRFQNVAELAQELRPFASPNAQARIEHVVRIVSEAGERVRPPTPLGDAMSVRSQRDVATLVGEGRNVLTTSGQASWGGPAAQAHGFGRWGRIGIATGLALVAGFAVAAVVHRSPRAASAASPDTTVAAAVPTAPSLPAAPPLASAAPPPTAAPTASAQPAAQPVAGPATSSPTPAASSVPAPAGSPGVARGAAPKPGTGTRRAPSGKGAPTPLDTNAVLNPFE